MTNLNTLRAPRDAADRLAWLRKELARRDGCQEECQQLLTLHALDEIAGEAFTNGITRIGDLAPYGDRARAIAGDEGARVMHLLRIARELPPRTVIRLAGFDPIVCHGTWEEGSNCAVICDNPAYDGIYADGGKNWTEVARKLAAWALDRNTFIVELQAC